MSKSSKGHHAVRIISIDDKGEGFTLDESALRSILNKIPDDMKVSVISVVGAFRTGKSFLLDLFLRYLYHQPSSPVKRTDNGEPDQTWMRSGGNSSSPVKSPKKSAAKSPPSTSTLQGNLNGSSSRGDESRVSGGFGWRSGKDRCTTGIWMWNDIFYREVLKEDSGKSGETEKIAVLLIDTQGMFDSSTGQMLTAAIFGLSTLISSYQIYNIDKRIQEDNLQHLALFTEYGRVVSSEERRVSQKVDLASLDLDAEMEVMKKESRAQSVYSAISRTISRGNRESAASVAIGGGSSTLRPFQRLELLVRDWQDFDDDDVPMEQLRKEMRQYLEQVLNERSQKDLKQVREQIRDCFETVSCFLLPHPGFDATKKTYDGDLTKLQPQFQRLMSEYARLVFTARLVPKKVGGRAVTAQELFQFVKVYATLFKEAKIFPEAKTLLAATSEANNRAALDMGLRAYKSAMDQFLGVNKAYVEEAKLKEFHVQARQAAVTKFHSVATMGAKLDVVQYERMLENDIAVKFVDYTEANKLRDPYSFVGPFVIPLLVAIFAYVLRVVVDWTCFGLSDHCVSASEFLQMLYTAIFAFGFFHMIATGHGVRKRLHQMVAVFAEDWSATVKSAVPIRAATPVQAS